MDELKQLTQIDWWYVFIALLLLLICIKLIWSLFDWLFFEKLGIETRKMKQKRQESELLKATAEGLAALKKKHDKDESKLEERESKLEERLAEFIDETRDIIKNQADTIKNIVCDNQEKGEQINSLVIAQKEILAEKINEKYKYYISIGGIPEDEYDEFVSMHKAYNGVGGNSHGDAKFEYCIEHLPIIPVETKLTIKHKN